jgi:hypothetical protein
MTIGARVIHADGLRMGVVVAIRRVEGGNVWLKVHLDSGEVVARPVAEWSDAEGRYS